MLPELELKSVSVNPSLPPFLPDTESCVGQAAFELVPQLSMALNIWLSRLRPPSAGITGVHRHA